MKRPIGNTVHPDDYAEISYGVAAVQSTTNFMHQRGVVIEIPHQHRFWEYGTAVQILSDHFQDKLSDVEVLDVGSGMGAVGPSLAMHFNTQVVECEPDLDCRNKRIKCNVQLKQLGKREIIVVPNDALNLPDQQFDAVLCVSVIEHMTPEDEQRVWGELAKRVKPNGVLYITMDCVPQAGRKYVFDNLRQQNFTPDMIKDRIEKLIAMGFTPMGQPSYKYNGDHVFDYTFFRIGLLKVRTQDESRAVDNMEGKVRDSRVRPVSDKVSSRG